MRSRSTAVACLLVAATALLAPGVDGAVPNACALTTHDKDWLRESLDAWDEISTRILHLAPGPRPPIILFDAACEYRLAADAAAPVGRLHGGHVALPNGQR